LREWTALRERLGNVAVGLQTTLAIAGADRNEDRAAFIEGDAATILVVADGAGGMGGGAEAAELVVRVVEEAAAGGPLSGEYWSGILRRCDEALHLDQLAGETTAVIVSIANGMVSGSSVGDSGAVIFWSDESVDLTTGQKRKPLLGSGRANPVAFGPVQLESTLVVASDGLWKYAPWRTVAEAAAWARPEELIDLARLPSGGLQDDVAVIVARLEQTM
jgi:PPM family protein phosphatase